METDMPNPTNFIGQCISYRIDPGQANVATGALAPKTGMTSAANVRIGNDPRNLIGGTQWNFTFLKYSAGDVTTCPLNGNAMTGPFSGCYAFTYSSNGQQTLAHVGTAHNAEDAGSVRAKQVWQGIVLGGATNIKGESPAKQFTVSEQQKVGSENRNQLPIVCSYYEGGNAWAILFVPAVAGVTPIQGVLRIAMAKPMPQLDWNLVKAMREFR
jgi:hypothetical protein